MLKKKKTWMIIGLLAALLLSATLALGQEAAKPTAPAAPAATAAPPAAAPAGKMSKLEEAIAKTPKGKEKGMIDPDAPKGFLGIPGAPRPLWVFGILWGIWVGWIFSTVGAFGGIMAGVGHISIFGLGDYAHSFRKTSPVLNKLVTDSIRTSNQYLVGLSSLMSSITYYRLGRLAYPLGLALALGGIAGAYLIPVLTGGKIELRQYVGYFGLIVFVIGGFLLYDTTPMGIEKKKKAKEAAKAFEESVKKGLAAGEMAAMGIKVKSWGLTRIDFSFYGVDFHFNPIWPFVGGFFIAALSAFLGIGGGFLYVPFCTNIVQLPMYVSAGTSALAVFVSMITSIFSFMFVKGTPIDFVFVGAELVGIATGSVIGPITSKYIPDVWLKRLFVILALYVGLGYTLRGFADIRLPGI